MALYKFCFGSATDAASPPMAAVTFGGSQSTMSVPPNAESTMPMGTCAIQTAFDQEASTFEQIHVSSASPRHLMHKVSP